MIVIGEDAQSNPPTLAYCSKYAQDKGINPEQVFIDNTGGQSWASLLGAIENYSGGSFGIPWNVVLDGKSMEYEHSDTAAVSDSREVVLQKLYDEFAAEN